MNAIKNLITYEHREQPLMPAGAFMKRVLWHSLVSLFLVAISLGAGVLGYHFTEGLPWLDALLNAAMILSGMGPVNELHTVAGKLFAASYALFSGFVFLVAGSIVVAPVAHRLLHRLHLETGDDNAA